MERNWQDRANAFPQERREAERKIRAQESELELEGLELLFNTVRKLEGKKPTARVLLKLEDIPIPTGLLEIFPLLTEPEVTINYDHNHRSHHDFAFHESAQIILQESEHVLQGRSVDFRVLKPHRAYVDEESSIEIRPDKRVIMRFDGRESSTLEQRWEDLSRLQVLQFLNLVASFYAGEVLRQKTTAEAPSA